MKHIVGFSGGADSQATAGWVLDRFDPADVILLNTDAGGNEHPMTVEFIRQYSETLHPVITVPAIVADMRDKAPGKIAELGLKPDDPLTFDLLAKIKGRFPSTKVRFCTNHLKLQPQLRWMNERRGTLLKGGFERYIGVRRDESDARSEVDEREYDDFFLCWLNRPLATWTKYEVFAFLELRGEEVNPLYRLGFGRVGCAPCINSSKEDVRLWASRFPEMIAKVREWELKVGRTFFPPCMPGNRYGFVDEVVEWARTTHGGKQYSLPILEADVQSGMCMSKWGLCE
jgi:3'-phosphoadenosine 5'-phosphosulfate sulfotransferase (PAPS reductase)/FAD synthetase